MSLENKVIALATVIGRDIKLLREADGDLTALSTTAKDNLVNAINEIYAIASDIANRVRFDAPQPLTAAQQLQACQNIGAGNPEHDFVADYTAIRDA